MSSIVRALGTLRTLRTGVQSLRNYSSHAHVEPQYRQYPQLTKQQIIQGEVLSGAMWFWILWNFWKTPDEVLGHFPWPDTSKWTDEELGIPPDDEE